MIPITYLFVPGNRPERFAKALASGADRVILDLEDAVSPADKPQAREAIGAWIATLDSTALAAILVRLNDALSPWHAEDLVWLSAQPVGEVMLSKCESAGQIAAVHARMARGARVLPLIETVRGVMGLNDMARAPQVSRLAFGSIDYLLDLDLPGPGFALDAAATAIAMASRAAELPPPVAGVTPELEAG
ncbi:MAG: aldolase/citrate lyase family protein, partial [Aquabacterium sp.]